MSLIVADGNIPFVEETFSSLGRVRRLASTELDAAAVRDADLLLVRSTVKVGPQLLAGSRVRFVATATIGIDHLDLPWLRSQGIAWASAPGSNADSVLQWFASALFLAARRLELDLAQLRVGIVGVGAVGSRIERLCRALGRPPLCCDPPRARVEGGDHWVELDRLLEQSDLVTLHVPLERAGPDPSFHLIDPRRLERMRPGALLVNASRGAVVDGQGLLGALRAQRIGGAILDVWEGEPTPDPALVEAALLATPHIAGHSLDGKVAGTQQIYEAACAFLGVVPSLRVRDRLPSLDPSALRLDEGAGPELELVDQVLRRFYPIEEDDRALRALVREPDATRAAAFRRYRQGYPARREPRGLRVVLPGERPWAARVLGALGCVIGDPGKA